VRLTTGVGAALLIAALGAVRSATSARVPTNTAPRAVQPPLWPTSPGDPTSAALLARLPDGLAKRKFLLDCTGCHQFSARVAYPSGRARTAAEWEAAVTRMLRYGGARGPFPVIHSDRDAAATAAWLARHLPAAAPARVAHGPGEAPARLVPPARTWAITEYALPAPSDLPHDVAVAADGRVVVTGMMTDQMYVLDPRPADAGALDARAGRFEAVPIPVPRANPRAVEIDAAGRWWVALGVPHAVAVYDPSRAAAAGLGAGAWRTVAAGVYPHSVAPGPGDGEAWFNGHFTRAPALIGRVRLAADGGAAPAVDSVALAPHPTLADDPGGPIPYEIRVAPDGIVWTSELHGNRLVAHDPRTQRTWAVDMPEPHTGPRRFDIDASGALWVPAYAANALVRYDPRRGRFTRVPLPIGDAVPYVARVDHAAGHVWVGTSAADAVLRYTPRTGAWAAYPLPSRGALVRHLAVDRRTGDVWVAYGASPGPAAKIARLTTRAP
jgi:streptogramin lyase